jgi:uncharacterized damage-inducible protein DinB
MNLASLIDDYRAGPNLLRSAVAELSQEELVARPLPGQWSALEVVCHVADTESLYAERIKMVVAEEHPRLPNRDPETYVTRLNCQQRNLEEELALVDATRRQLATILSHLTADDFDRIGEHSTAGPLTVAQLLERVTGHIPHHVRFIEEKRRAMGK